MPMSGPRWIRVVTALACASLLVVALVATAAAAPALVRGIGTRWSPAIVTVERGAVVRWRGVSKYHDVVAYGRNWTFNKALPVGAAVQKAFHQAGTFRFRCTYHSTLIGNSCTGMCGKVVVRS